MLDNYTRNKAKGVTGLIMDVNTGAIIALASVPTFDANAIPHDRPALFTSPAVSRQYEPGSVLKAVTVAAALDAGAITRRICSSTTTSSRSTTPPSATLTASGGRAATGSSPRPRSSPSRTTSARPRSGSRLAAIACTTRSSGSDSGRRRGSTSRARRPGVVLHPDDPGASQELTTAQNAFGQGISVTVVQMAAAYAAIANGGELVTPHVVAGWTTATGRSPRDRWPRPSRSSARRPRPRCSRC